MSVRTITRVWEHSKQSSTDLLLLLAIADHADDDGISWPGIARLAQKTRTSERQTIRNVEKLSKSGEIFLSRQCGRGNSNLYFVTIGLSPKDITQVLISRFELAENEAKNTTEAIIKGDISDRVLPEKKVTSGTIKGDIQRKKVTSVTLKGDIAMSPEPLEPSLEPSIKERCNRPSMIPSFKIFTEITNYFAINKHWQSEMDKVVGNDLESLDFWRQVIIGWTGKYSTKHNVKGMLEYYQRREIPGYNGNGATNGHNKQNNGSGYTSGTDPNKINTVSADEWAAVNSG